MAHHKVTNWAPAIPYRQSMIKTMPNQYLLTIPGKENESGRGRGNKKRKERRTSN